MGFEYAIVRGVAMIGRYDNQTKELNVISYNNKPPKYDLRTWKEEADGKRTMGKGITLTRDEARALKDALDAEFREGA